MEYVGTCPCPQHMGRNSSGHVMCEHRANVYKLDASQDNYMSKCPVGHSQHFGGYYLQYVNGNAPEIELPPPPPTT